MKPHSKSVAPEAEIAGHTVGRGRCGSPIAGEGSLSGGASASLSAGTKGAPRSAVIAFLQVNASRSSRQRPEIDGAEDDDPDRVDEVPVQDDALQGGAPRCADVARCR